MKKVLRVAIASLTALLVILCIVSPAFADTAKWEYYSTGVDSQTLVWGPNWAAQTFTVGAESHSITSVRLLLYRIDSPGTVTVSIRATSADVPTGADLTSGTIDGDLFTTDTNGSWYEIDLTEYSLTAATQYAIVVRAPSGTGAGDTAAWKMDGSTASLADGSEAISTDGGITWADDSDDDYYFEVWGDNLIDIDRCEVYSGYLEDNDMLFVGQYLNNYVPYYPFSDPSRYFDIQLRSTDGATVIAQTICTAWGNKPCSLYLSADQAAGLTTGTAYRIYIAGPAGAPATYYTLTSADWRGDDLTYLKTWALTTAYDLEDYYGVTLTTYVAEKGIVLNEEGGVLFENGIPGLDAVLPEAFQVVIHEPYVGTSTWTNDFDEGDTWEDKLGPTVSGVLTDWGDTVGADGDEFGGFVLLFIYIAVAIFPFAKGHITSGLALGIPVALAGAWLHLIDIRLVGVILSFLVILIVWSFFWNKT